MKQYLFQHNCFPYVTNRKRKTTVIVSGLRKFYIFWEKGVKEGDGTISSAKGYWENTVVSPSLFAVVTKKKVMCFQLV